MRWLPSRRNIRNPILRVQERHTHKDAIEGGLVSRIDAGAALELKRPCDGNTPHQWY